jgi:hypothetical protein
MARSIACGKEPEKCRSPFALAMGPEVCRNDDGAVALGLSEDNGLLEPPRCYTFPLPPDRLHNAGRLHRQGLGQ